MLCVPQQAVTSPQVVQTTKSTYSYVWFVVFVTDDYLSRAWCCMEISVATGCGCKITVVGFCKMVREKKFYQNMVASVPSDIPLIQAEIKSLYGTEEKFNDAVALAMEVLVVEGNKQKVCELFNTRRVDRPEWSRYLSVTQLPSMPRDRNRDFDVLSGAFDLNIPASPLTSNNTSRSLRIFLLSTLADTVLEWSFFNQDVWPFLLWYARLCQLDLVFCDLRCGSREDEALPLQTVMAELERCKTESAGLCCIMLLGDK